jgi:hypothetical protein
MMVNIVLAVLGSLSVIGGLGAFYWFQRTRRFSQQCREWPSARGKVVVSEVRETDTTDNDGKTDTTYSPRIEYEYAVGSETHRGSRIQFGGPWGGSEAGALRYVQRYPLGAEVEVAYDPAAPERCTLERETPRSSFVGIAVLTSFLLGLGALLVWLAFVAQVTPSR